MQQEYMEALLQSKVETQEAAFHQLSREIHDNIGQLLSSTKILLCLAERSLDNVPDTLKTAEYILGKAIQDLRSVSKKLNTDKLKKFDIIKNLKTEIEHINNSGTIHAEFYTSARCLPMPADAQLILFRVVQEAIQNIIGYASASRIKINTWLSAENINIKIEEDGICITNPKQNMGGNSITTILHRTQLLGGNIIFKTLPRATQLTITLPIQNQNL